jgi:hypothetical protein
VIALSDDVVIKLLVGIPIALYGASVTGKRIVKRWWAPFDSLTNGASSDPARPRNRPRPRPIAGPRNRPRPMGHRPSPSRSHYETDAEYVAAVDAWRAGRIP